MTGNARQNSVHGDSNCTQSHRIPSYRAMMSLKTKINIYSFLCKRHFPQILSTTSRNKRQGDIQPATPQTPAGVLENSKQQAESQSQQGEVRGRKNSLAGYNKSKLLTAEHSTLDNLSIYTDFFLSTDTQQTRCDFPATTQRHSFPLTSVPH